MKSKYKTYDLVKDLLTDYPELRDSDKKLIWEVWKSLEIVHERGTNTPDQIIYFTDFMKAPSTETIRRCRQKIQELHPELQSSKRIRDLRQARERQRGTFVFRELF